MRFRDNLVLSGTTLDALARASNIVRYSFSAATTEPPSAEQVRFDAGFPYTAVTKVWVRHVNYDGLDVFWGLMLVAVGAEILVQDANDHTSYVRFTVTAAPVDDGDYVEFAVAHHSHGTALSGGQPVLMQAASVGAPSAHASTHDTGGSYSITALSAAVLTSGKISPDARLSSNVPLKDAANVFTADLTANGNVTLGDASSDTVTVNARFASALAPSTDAARDLGIASTNRWRDLFLSRDLTMAGSINVSATNAIAVTAVSGNIRFLGSGAPEVFFSGVSGATAGLLSSNGSVTVKIDKDNNGTTSVFMVTPPVSRRRRLHGRRGGECHGQRHAGAAERATEIPRHAESPPMRTRSTTTKRAPGTPTIGGSGGQSGQAYTTQSGSYIKIGQQVIAWFNIELSTLGTITGNAEVQGLPFTCNTAFPGGAVSPVQFNALTTNWINVQTVVFPNSTIARLRGNTAAATGNATALVQGDLSNTTSLAGMLIYQVSA